MVSSSGTASISRGWTSGTTGMSSTPPALGVGVFETPTTSASRSGERSDEAVRSLPRTKADKRVLSLQDEARRTGVQMQAVRPRGEKNLQIKAQAGKAQVAVRTP